MKRKLPGAVAQASGVFAPAVLTLSILRLYSTPEPLSGVKSSEKADIRRILAVGPVPFRMFAETFQLVAVSPAGATYGAEKVTTVESKVKSPWKPM